MRGSGSDAGLALLLGGLWAVMSFFVQWAVSWGLCVRCFFVTDLSGFGRGVEIATWTINNFIEV